MNYGFFKLHEFKKKKFKCSEFLFSFSFTSQFTQFKIFNIFLDGAHFFNLLTKCISDPIINLVNTKDSKREERIPQVLLPSHPNQP